MDILRLGPRGKECPAIRDGSGVVYDLSRLTDDIHGEFLASGGIERAEDAVRARTLPVLAEASTLRIGAPIARSGAVICIGQNFAAHAAEAGSAPPKAPIVFLK